MGVDQPSADRGSRCQPQIRRRCLGQPPPKRRAGLAHRRADARKALVGQLPQSDLPKIAGIPAAIMAEIGPFAGHRADRARQIARGLPGQEIGQVHELPGPGEDLGPVFLQPEQLRRLHLGRDATADEIQHPMAQTVDPRRLLAGAMIHPDHDIALGMGRIADRQGRATLAQHHQRAGGVEADPADLAGRDPGFGHRAPRGGRDGAPDILARLLDDAAGVAMGGNVLLRGAQQNALPVEDPGPRAAGADIDAEKIVAALRHRIPPALPAGTV